MEDSTFCLRISKLTDTLEVVRDVLCSLRMEKRQNHVRINSESESEQFLRQPWREKGVVKGVVVLTMQLKFQQSFLFMVLEVLQIQFNSGCRTFQLCATGTVMVVNCLANRSDKLQQVHFRRRCKLCRKPLCFHNRSSWCLVVDVLVLMPGSLKIQAVLFLAQRLVRQWTHDMRLFLVAFGRAHTFST